MQTKIRPLAKSILFVFCIMLNTAYAQTFNYGTGNVSGNLAPFASGNVNVTVSGNSVTVTGNTTISAGTYNFENFTINPGVTVSVTGTGAPLIIRCTGTFTNNGILSANGGNGANGTFTTANMASGGIGVAGGTNGGVGGGMATNNYRATRGASFGTSSGGGWQPCNSPTGSTNTNGQYGAAPGGGGGYSASGSLGGTQYSGNIGSGCATRGNGGSAYGNVDLTLQVGASSNYLSEGIVPESNRWIIAGSGGGGGGGSTGLGSGGGGGGGGAGGGAIQIVADVFISGTNGIIRARGGNGGTGAAGFYGAGAGGGGGSGGTIHIAYLTSYTMNNSNTTERIDVRGGNGGNAAHSDIMGSGGSGGSGSLGRFLIEEDEILQSCTTVEGIDVIHSCSPITWIDGNSYNQSNNTATYLIEGAAQNGCDSLVTLNFTLLQPAQGVDVVKSCGSITWIDNNTYSQNNNTATYVIAGGASNGCDSIVTLNLIIWSCIQLQPSDCGASEVEMTQIIGAIHVPGHAGYRFRITGANNGGIGWNGNTFILDRPVRNFRFSHVPGAIWGETYSVEVAYALVEGEYGPFGAPCDVTLIEQIPTTQIQSSQCGISNIGQNISLFANQVSNATGYRFKITGLNNGSSGWNGNTYILNRTTRDFKFNMVPGVIWGATYSVEVAVLSADNVSYSEYGAPCNITLEGIPTTSLQSSQCGITNVAQNTSLFANAVSGAAGYRFRVVGANNGSPGWVVDTYILDRPVRNFKFNMIPGVLQGEEYEVQVAVLDANGNYGAYGSVCTITLAGVPDFVINDENEIFLTDKTMNVVEFGASASHNPFTTDFGIQVLNANDSEAINVVIYDMSGKLIESNTVNPMDIESARFGQNLAAGMYMITVVQGSNQAVIRQVKN